MVFSLRGAWGYGPSPLRRRPSTPAPLQVSAARFESPLEPDRPCLDRRASQTLFPCPWPRVYIVPHGDLGGAARRDARHSRAAGAFALPAVGARRLARSRELRRL